MPTRKRIFLSAQWIFNILVVYIIAFTAWWIYLQLKTSRESFEDKRALLELKHSLNTSGTYPEESIAVLRNKYHRQFAMIIGEGSVFIGLLLWGIWLTRRSLTRELALSRQQRNFLLSITHELKSPLAAIKLTIQTLQKRELQAEKREQLLDNALQDTDRLQELVENILMAAKIENHSYTYQREAFNLSELVGNIAHKWKDMEGDSRIFKIEVEENVMIKGDYLSLSSVVHNLVENAVKYTLEGEEIRVSLSADEQQATLEIADTGQGIPLSERAAIFRKFYRVGNEDTRQSKGTGLGLYIVQQVVLEHQGTIVVTDNEPKGVCIRIRLPVA